MAKKYMDYERAVTMLARFGLREEDVREKVSEYYISGRPMAKWDAVRGVKGEIRGRRRRSRLAHLGKQPAVVGAGYGTIFFEDKGGFKPYPNSRELVEGIREAGFAYVSFFDADTESIVRVQAEIGVPIDGAYNIRGSSTPLNSALSEPRTYKSLGKQLGYDALEPIAYLTANGNHAKSAKTVFGGALLCRRLFGGAERGIFMFDWETLDVEEALDFLREAAERK